MIASAVQKGAWVHVYNERGTDVFQREGELLGFTGTTVTIKHCGAAYTFDENGSVKFSRSL